MKSKTNTVLAVMNVLSWIVFIGLMIQAGAILTSYIVSIKNPEAAKNLYSGLNLYSVRQFDFLQYTGAVSLNASVIILEAYIAYLLTRVLSKIKMSNPFTLPISNLLQQISYFMLVTWGIAMLYNRYVSWLLKKVPGMKENFISGDFIFMAGVVFVIAQVFKKGIEIQSENELTV